MKCRICKQKLRLTRTMHEHVREKAPMGGDLCTGCWVATVELEKFLVRATDRGVIGNWTEGWLKEIIKNPSKHL